MHELECALSCSCPVAAHPPPFHRHFSKNIAENWWLFFRNCWEEISLKQPAKSALTESAASRLPSIKSPPSTAGAKTLRFEKAWFMEDQARGGGEGGWEIMPECPTATFFSNGSRLNLARYVAYIFFFFAKAMLTRWMASCCMFGDRKDKSWRCRAAAACTQPCRRYGMSLVLGKGSYLSRMSNEWPPCATTITVVVRSDGTERPFYYQYSLCTQREP